MVLRVTWSEIIFESAMDQDWQGPKVQGKDQKMVLGILESAMDHNGPILAICVEPIEVRTHLDSAIKTFGTMTHY